MKGGIVEINWHDSQPVLTLDFHPKSSLLATGGNDRDIKKEGVSDDDDNLPLSLSKFKKTNKKEPKQELDDDDEPISLVSLKKNMKLPNGNASKVIVKDKVKTGNVKVGGNKVAKVKKEEPVEEESRQEKPLKKKIKGEVMKKKAAPTKNAEGKVDKKGRKVYSLPGQRQDPPEERDPLRIFYETLLQQVPTSEMAAIWMMERGLLPEDEAAIVYEKKLRSKQQNIKSPIKVVSAAKTVKVSAKKPKEEPKESPVKPKSKVSKKRKANDDGSDGDDDDDFVVPLKRLKN